MFATFLPANSINALPHNTNPSAIFGFSGVEPGTMQRRASTFSPHPSRAIAPSAHTNPAPIWATHQPSEEENLARRRVMRLQVTALSPPCLGQEVNTLTAA